MSYATQELSRQTWPDFETFLSAVHGCACTLYSFGRHFSLEGKNAAERARIYGVPAGPAGVSRARTRCAKSGSRR